MYCIVRNMDPLIFRLVHEIKCSIQAELIYNPIRIETTSDVFYFCCHRLIGWQKERMRFVFENDNDLQQLVSKRPVNQSAASAMLHTTNYIYYFNIADNFGCEDANIS